MARKTREGGGLRRALILFLASPREMMNQIGIRFKQEINIRAAALLESILFLALTFTFMVLGAFFLLFACHIYLSEFFESPVLSALSLVVLCGLISYICFKRVERSVDDFADFGNSKRKGRRRKRRELSKY